MIQWTWERGQGHPIEALVGKYQIEIYPLGDYGYTWDVHLFTARWRGTLAQGTTDTLEEAMATAKAKAMALDDIVEVEE